jgi:hypothetical protein
MRAPLNRLGGQNQTMPVHWQCCSPAFLAMHRHCAHCAA